MIRKLIRYGAQGGSFLLLNIAIQMVLVESGTLTPPIAAALSTALLPLLGYVAMNRVVFPTAETPPLRGHLRRFGQYYTVNMSSKVVNYVLFLGLLFVGVWYPIAYFIGAVVVFLGGFVVNHWIWHGSATA